MMDGTTSIPHMKLLVFSRSGILLETRVVRKWRRGREILYHGRNGIGNWPLTADIRDNC